MENQLSKKQKKVILVLGITGAVYLSFKYLLPLVVPFLFAYVVALGIRPIARFLHNRLRIRESIAAVIVVVLFIGMVAVIICFLGKQLILQLVSFVEYLPGYMEIGFSVLSEFCGKIEKTFGLEDGIVMNHAYDMCTSLVKNIKDSIMPYLMGKTVPIFKGLIQFIAVLVVTVTAVLLCVKEIDHFRYMKERSSFRTEMTLLSRRLFTVGGAYLKTQGIIIVFTTAICIVGLMFMGNSYSILLGVLIGLLDALPIFGTGTVLIPWALIRAVAGDVKSTIILIVIYLASYFLREILEARLMGKSLGITTLESLAAMYIGLQLFGIAGFILGPMAFLIIRELLQIYS